MSLTPMTWSSHQFCPVTATIWLCLGSGAFAVDGPNKRERSIVDGWLMQFPSTGQCKVESGGVKPTGVITYRIGILPGRGSTVPSDPTSHPLVEPTGSPSATGVRQKKLFE